MQENIILEANVNINHPLSQYNYCIYIEYTLQMFLKVWKGFWLRDPEICNVNSSYKIFEISNPDCDNPFQISGGVSISMGENFQTDSILIYHILYIDYILKRHNFCIYR